GGKPLDASGLEKLWAQLEGDDSRSAYRAIAGLADPSRVAFLAEKLRGLRVDRKAIERLIARLEDDKFGEREKATRALKQLGGRAEGNRNETLEQSPRVETRHRIEDILDALPKPASSVAGGERRRALRCLMVLERVRTPAARQLLKCLAEESGDSVVRTE